MANLARGVVAILALMLAPGLFADPGGNPACPPSSHDPRCQGGLPEPSAVPEFVLCLTLIGASVLILRRNQKSV
jgi:hypothetical protein